MRFFLVLAYTDDERDPVGLFTDKAEAMEFGRKLDWVAEVFVFENGRPVASEIVDEDAPAPFQNEVNVNVLVEVAMNDPEGAAEDGASAAARLEELAWGAGWSNEQTAGATDWAQVGEMVRSAPAMRR